MTIAEPMRRERHAEGRLEERAATLTKPIKLKFGEIGDEPVGRIAAATPAELDRRVERILTASSLDEIFGD